MTNNNALIGMSVYYALYGIERLGSLAGKDALGKINWFNRAQLPPGHAIGRRKLEIYLADAGTEHRLGRALLTKSTAKTLKRIEIKRLGAGTLLGVAACRSLSSMTVAGGRVVSRPMNGAVEGMLAVLEDPRAFDTADAAASGLVGAIGPGRRGPEALQGPLPDHALRPRSRRPASGRLVLARTGDLDVVPLLIGASPIPTRASPTPPGKGAKLLSRKIDGLGPPARDSLEQKREAQHRAAGMSRSGRSIDDDSEDEAQRGGPDEQDEQAVPLPEAAPFPRAEGVRRVVVRSGHARC